MNIYMYIHNVYTVYTQSVCIYVYLDIYLYVSTIVVIVVVVFVVVVVVFLVRFLRTSTAKCQGKKPQRGHIQAETGIMGTINDKPRYIYIYTYIYIYVCVHARTS